MTPGRSKALPLLQISVCLKLETRDYDEIHAKYRSHDYGEQGKAYNVLSLSSSVCEEE
jgi:hypothetical protein